MSEIPRTVRDLERLIRQHRDEWPDDLRTKAHRALLTLKSLDQKAATQSRALIEASKADLEAFASAYAEWRK